MYLKKLYVNGFKSIGKPVEVDLMNSVNVIMGPNGSGKSNFFECIQWVLGGMSAKQLRASSMEDVIFDGGSNFKASDIAEATLVFDNSDKELDIPTDEVSITRKLTRGKGTEYFINHKPAKLKDLTNLFLNKGIGKNNYAITGQNRITEFIMMKPDDIRGVIEEAAGISGFRLKKNELVGSIANYDRDIERIDAVIQEILRSIKPLKRQIKNAEIYEVTMKELNERKLYYYSKKAEELTNSIDENKSKMKENLISKEDLTNKKLDIENYLSSYDEKYNKYSSDMAELESQKNSLEEEVKELSKEKIMQENNLNNLLDKKDNMLKNIKKLEESSNVEENEKNDLFKSINDLSKDIDSIKSSIEKIDNSINEASTNIDKIEKELSVSKEKITEVAMNIDRAKKDKEVLLSNNSSAFDNSKIKEDELNAIKNDLKVLLSNVEDNKKHIATINTKMSEFKEVDSQIKAMDNILNASKKSEGRKKRTLDIKNMLKDVAGFKDVLFNIVSYNDKYINAMDTLYGSVLYNFVVEDVKSAEKCVSILKKNKIPPANFIIMSKIKDNKKSAKKLDNVVNVADILTYDKEYSELVLDYFSNSYIAEDSKIAESVWNDTLQKYRVCTLDGTLFASNIIRGGFIQKDSKKLKSEYDNLISKKKEILSFNDEVFSNIYELKAKIDVFSKENEVLNKQVASLKNTEASLEKDVLKAKERISSIQANLDSIDENISSLLKEKETLENKVANLNNSITLDNENLVKLKENRESLVIDINKKETLLEEYEKKYYVYKNNSKEQINSLKNNIDIVEDQISLTQDKFNKVNEVYTAKNNDLDIINNKLSEVKSLIENLRKEKDDASSSLNDIVVRISNLENAITKYEFNLENLSSKLEEIEEEASTIPEDTEFMMYEEDMASMFKSIQSLDKKIKSLGFINTDAISEYKELNSRYETMFNNKKDLEESKLKILTILQTMQDDMSVKYLECYNKLREDFGNIFTKLFNGGSAELLMENPDAPLESGVIIKATPPGKKNKAISLLSGGEKSLAAVSFIFALLKYSPSPVVIFDEIDAALDEINVSLIADYIKENNNVQYVIVSHRKPMMKIAKALYGASMNKGITELISQKL